MAAERIAVRFPPYKGGLVEIKGGRILGISRGLVRYHSDDRGRTWSKPEPVTQDGRVIRGEGDPVSLLRLASGKIALTYGRPLEREELPPRAAAAFDRYRQLERSGLFFRTSSDEGKTWSREVMVRGPGVVWWYALNDTLIQLRSGRLLWPCYGGSSAYRPNPAPKVEGLDRGVGHLWAPENVGISKCFYSDDEGAHWKAPVDDLMMWIDHGRGNLTSVHEITAAEARDGRIVALSRSDIMRVIQTFSTDRGEHWTLAELSELNTSNAPVRVKRIPKTDDLMVVWNQVTAEEHRLGYGRCRLSAAISKDGGTSWTNFRNIWVTPGLDERPRVVDPEPPKFVRPGSATRPDDPPPENPIRGQIRASYPNFYFFSDEVFIEHDTWFRTNLWGTGDVPREWEDLDPKKGKGRKLHIIPLDWFYQG